MKLNYLKNILANAFENINDANEIYYNLLNLIKKVSKKIINKSDLFVSLTNQRETFVIFDTHTGKPLCNAIVWQCRRGQEILKI